MTRVYRIPSGIWIDYPIQWLQTYIDYKNEMDVVAEGSHYSYSTVEKTIDNTHGKWAVLTQNLTTRPITFYWLLQIHDDVGR
jgi:hypothetical protein